MEDPSRRVCDNCDEKFNARTDNDVCCKHCAAQRKSTRYELPPHGWRAYIAGKAHTVFYREHPTQEGVIEICNRPHQRHVLLDRQHWASIRLYKAVLSIPNNDTGYCIVYLDGDKRSLNKWVADAVAGESVRYRDGDTFNNLPSNLDVYNPFGVPGVSHDEAARVFTAHWREYMTENYRTESFSYAQGSTYEQAKNDAIALRKEMQAERDAKVLPRSLQLALNLTNVSL